MKILEFARLNDINKILFASTSEIYGSAKYVPMNEEHPLAGQHPYGVSKIAADRLCYSYNETYGLGVDIVRCFNLFGPKQKDSGYGGVIAIFINRILQNKPPIIYGDGVQTRDYMYIDDAVQAYDLMLQSKGNPGKNGINFGTGSEKSINDIAKLILMYSDNSLETDKNECNDYSNNYAYDEKRSNLTPIHVDARPTEVQRLYADISKAKDTLGFRPTISLEKGISLLINWYRKYKSEVWVY